MMGNSKNPETGDDGGEVEGRGRFQSNFMYVCAYMCLCM